MTNIYGLYDKKGQLRYIGKAHNPEKRLASHMRDARRRDTPVYRWIRKNGMPAMRILAAGCDDWRTEERRIIAEARINGIQLLNVADGGNEPFCSQEVRRSNANKMNARIASDSRLKRIWEIKRALGQAMRDPTLSPEFKASLAAKMRVAARSAPKIFGKWIDIGLSDVSNEDAGL